MDNAMYPPNKPFRLSMSVSVFCIFLTACGGNAGDIGSIPSGLENKTEVANKVTNNKPQASNVIISGDGKIGSILTLKVDFYDEDGDKEGKSIISWTTSTSELQRGESKKFKVPSGLSGDTISAWIHPIDKRGAEGKAVRSANDITIDQNEFSITNSPTTVYENLLAHRGGFAKDVTGGAGGKVVVISNLNDSSLSNALKGSTPRWIRFSPGLTGTWKYPDGKVHIGSNKTIDGRGANVTFSYQYNGVVKDLDFIDQSNLIIHNITFKDIGKKNAPEAANANRAYGVALWAVNSDKIWIDHCTFTRVWDDALVFNNSEVTISYSNFIDQNKNVLIEGSRGKTTLHHNHHDGSTVKSWLAAGDKADHFLQRSPLLRHGKLHSYNNLINKWGPSGASSRLGAQAIYENNIFGLAQTSQAAIKSKKGYVCQRGNILEDRSVPMKGVWDGTFSKDKAFNCSKVFSVPYQYVKSTANSDLKKKIKRMAGRSNSPKW